MPLTSEERQAAIDAIRVGVVADPKGGVKRCDPPKPWPKGHGGDYSLADGRL